MKDWFEHTRLPAGNSDKKHLLYKMHAEWGNTTSHPPKWETRFNAVFRTRRPEYLIRVHKILTDIDEGMLNLQVPRDTCTFCMEIGHHSSSCPTLGEYHQEYGRAYMCEGCNLYDTHLSHHCVKRPKEDEARLMSLERAHDI